MRFSIILFIVLSAKALQSQPAEWGGIDRWESLNPGAGGQVQDVFFDRHTENRIWFCSDMEGVYRSDDSGQKWKHVSRDLTHHMSFLVMNQVGGTRVFEGGMNGAHYSDNAGADPSEVTWDMIEPTRGDAIASIAISQDHQLIVLAPGWKNKDAQKCQAAITTPVQGLSSGKLNGERIVYISKDGGDTWAEKKYEPTDGYRHVFSVEIDPDNNIYLGSSAGVYFSSDGGDSFARIDDPSQALGKAGNSTACNSRPNGGSRGIGLSPDGNHIYAVYQTSSSPKNYSLFVASTSDTGIADTWQQVSDDLSASVEWYKPEVDPRSDQTNHQVLIGNVWNGNTHRVGLWEGTFSYELDGSLKDYEWAKVVDKPAEDNCFEFEMGWEDRDMIVRSYDYSPTFWGVHQIVMMGGQNVYLGDKEQPNYPCGPSVWHEIYGEIIDHDFGPVVMSHERGFSSTYAYDVSALDNYAIQGCADHGIMQSLDYGYSWTSAQTPNGTNAMSVLTIPLATPIVLADLRAGYGAPSQTVGAIYAKTINPENIGYPSGWKLIGGAVPNGSGTTNGLPSRNFRVINYDPKFPERVYIGIRGKSGANGGIYMTSGIQKIIDGEGAWEKITPSSFDNYDIRDIWVDPNNSSIVYARSATSGNLILKGVNTSGVFDWTTSSGGISDVSDIALIDRGENTWLVASGTINSQFGVFINESINTVDWSNKGNWKFTGLDIAASLTLRPEKSVTNTQYMSFSGLAANGQYIIINRHATGFKKGLGSFAGTIQPDGSVLWQDWTDTSVQSLYQSDCNQAKILRIKDTEYYYVATVGAGAWRRALPTSSEKDCSVDFLKHTFEVDAPNDQVVLSVLSSEAWSPSTNHSFLSVVQSGSQLVVDVTNNASSDVRTGTVSIVGCETRTLTITQKGNQQPEIAWNLHELDQEIEEGEEFSLSVVAKDPDGSISSVTIYVDESVLKTSDKVPLAAPLIFESAGTYEVSAEVVDDLGAVVSLFGTVAVKPARVLSVAPGQRANLLLYPNPCSDEIVLVGNDALRINIFDLQGRIIQGMTQVNRDNKWHIDTSKLQVGMYQLCMNDGQSCIRFRRE
ncbi:T9SS type A sorting domain-containing protein [Reichenbachiella carrageenanivorans]|uniref:T9SS type A sorting domain-containing protein n=1 Tax=Reichenbachiella carrageenanivorans TaxID=2979869 RepID=A0ABY6D3L5_9BACT|nr:T9SS type A sorting domain-containing protein [Reichenbachiella carrageenanivorans]UXX80741.1 T9SS type A sorting domain-containing protein [Reichenbachiella carrageenanivorans]